MEKEKNKISKGEQWLIQGTGASAENGSPHRNPPLGTAVTGVQVYLELCVCAHEGCHIISYISFCTHPLLGVLWCVCVCVF